MFLEGVCCVEDAKPTTLPTELLDLIIQFALLLPHNADSGTTSLGLFAAIAPFSLASTQFRSLALRRKKLLVFGQDFLILNSVTRLSSSYNFLRSGIREGKFSME
jgi:hypothetical protein